MMENLSETEHFSGFRRLIDSYAPISDANWASIRELFFYKYFKKGDFLLSPGESANFVFFVSQGAVMRYFVCVDGKSYITDFDGPSRMVSDFPSFIEKNPSKIFIQAIQDSHVLVSSLDFAAKLRSLDPVWEKIGRLVAEERYIEKCNREYNFLHYEASIRFQKFKEKYKSLYPEIPKKNVASYLGISPETLSRISKGN